MSSLPSTPDQPLPNVLPNAKMGILSCLARKLGLVFAVGLVLGAVFSNLYPSSAQAAYYDPHYWYLTTNLSYDSISPAEVNANVNGIGPLTGLVGIRLAGERGLVAPNWTHWFEFGYIFGSDGGSDNHPTTGQLVSVNHGLRYWSLIPLGASFWFLRTAWIDFGVSLGLGLGLAPSYTLEQSTNNGPITTTQMSGSTAPLVDSRVTARLWANKYIGVNGSLGFKYFGTTLTSSTGSTLRTNSVALSVVVGVTYAFGGVRGTGRNYVEVIKVEPKTPPTPGSTPAAKPAVNPAQPSKPTTKAPAKG